MKIIIFGGNGFVGQWLIKKLQETCYDVLSCDLGQYSTKSEIPYLMS